MIEAISAVLKSAEQAIELNSNDYIENGLLHCGNCKTPKQAQIMLFGEPHIVPCDCRCRAEQYKIQIDEMKKNQFQQQINRNKSIGINNREMYSWTFENSNQDSGAIRTARKYVAKWSDMYKENVGLMFYGSTGTGKTYAAMCIANALLDMGVQVIATNFSRIIADMENFKTDSNEYVDRLVSCSLLIIDDLGAERNTSTATQYVGDIIDARIRANKPLIVTTNVSLEDMKKCTDIDKQRIYSRIRGTTLPVKAIGDDMRCLQQYEKLKAAQAMFAEEE